MSKMIPVRVVQDGDDSGNWHVYSHPLSLVKISEDVFEEYQRARRGMEQAQDVLHEELVRVGFLRG